MQQWAVGPGGGQIATFDYRKSRWIGDWLETAATGLELISAHPKVGPWGILLAGMGIGASELAEEAQQGDIVVDNDRDGGNWNEAVELTNSFNTPCVPQGYLHTECVMYLPLVVIHYDDTFYKCDQYDANGYNTTLNKMKRIPQGQIFYAGKYKRVDQPTTPTP